jgi:hypothetical protein
MRESEKNVVSAAQQPFVMQMCECVEFAATIYSDERRAFMETRRETFPFRRALVCFDQKLPRKQSAIKIRNQE